MTTELEDLLRFDAFATAERLTGQSYKEDGATSALGVAIFFSANEQKRSALEANDDTHYSTPFVDTLRIYGDEGFRVVYRHEFPSQRDDAETDQFVLLWNDGALAVVESYGVVTNSNKLYVNWRGDTRSMSMSGGSRDGVWVGDKDMREGTRHWLSRLRNEGEFVSPWVERPFLWFKSYSERDGDYKAITAARVAELPDDVRTAITPVGSRVSA